ncbi:MAG: hypothetical protein RSE00_04680 [Clostridia bacterium]
MKETDLMNYINGELTHNRNVDFAFDFEKNGVPYIIKFIAPDVKNGINIPSINFIPQTKNINSQIMVESNNLESDNLESVIQQASQTGTRLVNLTRDMPCPIVIPLIPSEKGKPYFQQLSKECFELPSTDINYRIDEQVVKIISNTKVLLKEKYNIEAKDKIFLNGYSSSGVFAQRFALLHPELIDVACIGGASGSIPFPSNKIGYPIGIEDYETLSGKTFDINAYESIKFRYYVGELETVDKSNSRFDENNMPASMHDMSYFDRSVPQEVGKKQREMLGRDMFDRANKTINILGKAGIDITHTVMRGRQHSSCNGLGEQFINNTYQESYQGKSIENEKAR